MRKAIVIDAEKCLTCGTCILHCAWAHGDGSDSGPQPRNYLEPIAGGGLPVQCRQCDDAPCTIICPKDALSRADADAPVVLDPDACIGCGMCTLVCPFGVIDVSIDKVAFKCDQCLLRPDKPGVPACAEACPTDAIEFVEIDEALSRRRQKEAEQVIAESAEHTDAAAEGVKTVACELCGQTVGKAKQLEVVRKKMPEGAVVPNICPKCRRRRTAAAAAADQE